MRRLLRLARGTPLALWLALCGALLPFTYPALAAPLRLSTPVGGADAIVVLGGGVDERGRPTPGTTERVLYGVGLWKEGYSPRLLFSTGAPGGISEARVMREMALALGVPPEAALTEERSLNTYENIREVDGIFRQKGWKRLILVSSPYHMRRIWMVRRKFSDGLETAYAPVRPSDFDRPENWERRLRYTWAVLREYAGIAWYCFRGYA